MAKDGSVGCVGFLVEETGACVLVGELDLVVLVGEAGSCVSGGQVRVRGCVLGCLWPYYDFRQPLC